jgi:paraquat-inducible protein A
MRVDFLGIPDRSTIMDGIIYFFQHGSYLIGLIIFIASILVPVFKIVGLIILLRSNHLCDLKLLRQKAKMFRFITFIGRWSMLDIFVIALLSVVVDFGFFTSIHVAPAATYFCIVVACTMFAVITFDPRIVWDKCNPEINLSGKKSSGRIPRNIFGKNT